MSWPSDGGARCRQTEAAENLPDADAADAAPPADTRRCQEIGRRRRDAVAVGVNGGARHAAAAKTLQPLAATRQDPPLAGPVHRLYRLKLGKIRFNGNLKRSMMGLEFEEPIDDLALNFSRKSKGN